MGKIHISLLLFVSLFFTHSCKKLESDSLRTDTEEIAFTYDGGEAEFAIRCTAGSWKIHTDAEWLTITPDNGTNGTFTIKVTAQANSITSMRGAEITVLASDSLSKSVRVIQDAALYPSYNTSPQVADATGMESNAVELANKIHIGWNIGNTLEATGGEISWGNPKVSSELITLVKQSGFNAIRIPCSWNQYMENSETAKLKESWLKRVKEVVQYCVDENMYVILNIHWDGGWLENNCTPDKQLENNAKQKAFWEQIATYMRDYDEHVIFASTNEPNVDNITQMNVLLSYHQTFVNAVRSTGGRNRYRVLVLQGASTDIEKTYNLMSKMPEDEIENRLMVEVHYYSPYEFCLKTEDNGNSKMAYFWGEGFHSATATERNVNWGEEAHVNNMFGLMKAKFVDKGIPVILGEYGAVRRTSLTGADLDLHNNSRAYYLQYVTQQARTYGIVPFYWDEGALGNNSFGIFNRNTNTVFDSQALKALIDGAANM